MAKSQRDFLMPKYVEEAKEVDDILKGGPGSGRYPAGSTSESRAEHASTKEEHNEAAEHHDQRAKEMREQKNHEAAYAHEHAAAMHRNAASDNPNPTKMGILADPKYPSPQSASSAAARAASVKAHDKEI